MAGVAGICHSPTRHATPLRCYTPSVSTVAEAIRIEVSGLFGPDGRYFEFNTPLTLEIEQDADGLWEHRLPALDIWSFGPTREISQEGLAVLLAGDYDTFALGEDDKLGKEARRRKKLLLDGIRAVV